jgi:hypothetical protein
MLKAKEHKVIEIRVPSVVVQVRDLALLQFGVSIQREADATSSSA